MPVSHEIKSQLAKLLATEDLIVEHKNVETAQFNVHTRVLILPQWDRASNSVYDMLVGHEVGHALFTPDVDPPKDIPHTFVNVCEDARIEKLMKRKYAGLAKTFYRGYNELYDQDFFEVDGQDINNFNLADRANLYFKIGSFLDISFSTPEKEIISLIQNAETFTETIAAAETLYNFCKQEQEEQQKEEQSIKASLSSDDQDSWMDDINTDSDDSDTDSGDVNNSNMEDDAGASNEPTNDASGLSGGESFEDKPEPEIETARSLDESLKNLIDTDTRENVYVEIPKIDISKIIVKNSVIHKQCKVEWDEQQSMVSDCFFEPDSEYQSFKKSAQKEVNYLVKEFECKKSANAYARATTARTGVLDTTNLHTYKFNEDLFKKISILPDGKNHGLVFILDWSGSMHSVMMDTLKQLYNLLWFCKKVNIPFDVYAFTMDYPLWTEEDGVRHSVYDKKEGLVQLCDNFSLMHFFTSKVNSKTLEEQMVNVYRIGYTFAHYCQYLTPLGMRLSGTPLNETIVALHQILPQFKKENKLQKVQCVILTDGEAGQMTYHREIQRHWDDAPYLGSGYINRHVTLRDRKLGTTYSFNVDGWSQITDQLLYNLRDNFPDMNFIGIRLIEGRDANSFIRNYCGYGNLDILDKTLRMWKKDKAFSIKTSGYHTYFGLSTSALASDAEFDVNEDATKAQIKRAFVKSLKNKKMNKKILNEFVELVA